MMLYSGDDHYDDDVTSGLCSMDLWDLEMLVDPADGADDDDGPAGEQE